MKQILRMLMVGSVAIAIGATASASTGTCLATQDVTLTIGTPKTVTLTNSYRMGPGSWSYQSVSPYSDISVAVTYKLQDGTTVPMATMSTWLNPGTPCLSGGSGSGSFSWNSSTPMSMSNPVTEMVLEATSSGTATGTVTIGDLSFTSGTCLQPVSGSSSSTPVTDSTPATASASIIQSDISRVTRSTVTANNSMMSQGLERFIRDRETGVSLAEAIVTRGNNGLALSPSFDASGNTLFGSLSFLDQSVSASGVYSKLSYGEFDVQHEVGAGTTVSFNGRMVWERAAGEDAMIGYFLGAALNHSNIEGSYTGDQTRYGLTGGMHGFKALNDNLYLSGYGSLGIARSSLDITDGASSVVTGDYMSRTLSLGGQVSGSVEYETYELRPSVSLNYVRTWVGDITLDNSGTPMDVDVGNTSFVELMAKPEFLFPMEQQAGSNMATTASVSPRLICERNTAAGTTTNQCGAGLGLGVNATSEDGATNLNASISFDRVGGVQQRGLNVQAEFRF